MLGGFAEVAVAPALHDLPAARRLDFAQGAALILNYHTAYFSLVSAAGAWPRARRCSSTAPPAASAPPRCRSPRAWARARSRSSPATRRSASRARPAPTRSCAPTARGRTQAKERSGGGVDVVLDPVGGDRFTDSLRSLREDGRAGRRRLHRRLDPRGQGQPAAAEQHRGRRRGLGRLRHGQAGVNREIGAALERADRRRASSRRSSARASRSSGAADALELIDGRGATGKVVLEVR